ncbi:MAG: alanine--tRNA ligase, partial [Methylophilaceae bacterium]|nr:alanine--tRNA ligase [Methylophilaceae bacterium]
SFHDQLSVTDHVSGDIAFKLHDTYGFPLDLTQDICREHGVTVDVERFHAAMAQQKAQARAAGKFQMDAQLDYQSVSTDFRGYDTLEVTATITALYQDGVPVSTLNAGASGVVVLDSTPFYAESGGQVGDSGVLTSVDAQFVVADTQKIQASVLGHHGTLQQGQVKVGDSVTAQVNQARRYAIMRNHSATHLMHKALREVLGEHVQQKGSLVDADKTRFDFAHHAPLSSDAIARVENIVNAEILSNTTTQARIMDMKSAQGAGAVMLFGEKYGDSVRVLDIGTSRELCGGTHVARTGDIGLLRIVTETGVAAGVRRVEAVTGEGALRYTQAQSALLATSAASLNTAPQELPTKLAQMLAQQKNLEKDLARLNAKLARSASDDLLQQAIAVGNIQVLAAQLANSNANTLREMIDRLRDKLGRAVVVLACVNDGKVSLAAGVTADLTAKIKAGELVNFVAQQVGGKGGGRADFAMAGGT